MIDIRGESARLSCSESFLEEAVELGIDIRAARNVTELFMLVERTENASREDICEPETDRRDSDSQ